MRKKNSRTLIAVLSLLLVVFLTAGLLAACTTPQVNLPAASENGSDSNVEDGGNDPADIGGNEGSDPGSSDPGDGLTAPLEQLTQTAVVEDSMELTNQTIGVTFTLLSPSVKLTTENLSDYVSLTDKFGNQFAGLSVLDIQGEYLIAPTAQAFVPGETYTILLDDGVYFKDKANTIRQIKFGIKKDEVKKVEYKYGIIYIADAAVLASSTVEIDSVEKLQIKVGSNVTYPIGAIVAINAADKDSITKDSEFGKVEAVEAVDGEAAVLLTLGEPTTQEIYDELDIYVIDEFDCSEVSLDDINEADIAEALTESELYYRFVTAIESYYEAKAQSFDDIKDKISDTVNSLKDKAKDILNNITVKFSVDHDGVGLKVAFTLGYEDDTMYIMLDYDGYLDYTTKASAKVEEGWSVEDYRLTYDVALIANNNFKFSLAVQWKDSEDDVRIKNETELANYIKGVLADKSTLPTKLTGLKAKSLGKGFSKNLLTLEYVIPSTPITINLELDWFVDFAIQGELYYAVEVNSVNTLGVRNKEVKDENGESVYKMDVEFYRTRELSVKDSKMFFGTITVKTGLDLKMYVSITGLKKYVRIGVEGKAGVYLELDGAYVKAESVEDKLTSFRGEIGWFVTVAVPYKVFVVSGNIAEKTWSGPIWEFGTQYLPIDFANTATIELSKVITTVDSTDVLVMNVFDLDDFEIQQEELTAAGFDFQSENNYIRVANNKFVVTSIAPSEFTEKVTVIYKNDPSLKTVLTVNYKEPVPEVVEPEVPVTPAEPEELEPYIPEPEEPTDPETPDPETPPTEPETPTDPVEPEPDEPEIVVPPAVSKVSFVSNGGNAIADKTATYNVTYKLPVPTRLGYDFVGWYNDNSVKVSDANGVFTMYAECDITLRAEWKKTYERAVYVETASAFLAIANSPKGFFFLMRDIDLGGIEWTTSFSESNPFMGRIEGNGFTVSNFTLTQAAENVGFLAVNAGTVNNINFKNVSVAFTSEKINVNAGVVAGLNKGTISNVFVYSSDVDVTMKGNGFFAKEYNGYVGGLVGYNDGSITSSAAIADVEATSENIKISVYVGGLIGKNVKYIEKNWSDGSVYGEVNGKNVYCGGLIGFNTATVKFCYSLSDAASGSEDGACGGFVGANEGTIYSCYAMGNVSGKRNIGGFAGTSTNSSISYSFATGTASASKKYVGGFIGGNGNVAGTKCYRIAGTVSGSNENTTGTLAIASNLTGQGLALANSGVWVYSTTVGHPTLAK